MSRCECSCSFSMIWFIRTRYPKIISIFQGNSYLRSYNYCARRQHRMPGILKPSIQIDFTCWAQTIITAAGYIVVLFQY